MSNKTDFQAKNTRLNANNTDLSSILETINNLPEAGGGTEDLSAELTEQDTLLTSQTEKIANALASLQGKGTGSTDIEDGILDKTISGNYYNDRITFLGYGALYGCENLKSLKLPEVTRVEQYSIQGCTTIETIEIPKTTYLGTYACRNCPALKSVDFSSVTSTGNYVCSGCSSLANIEFPVLTRVGNQMFLDCTSLTKVVLRKSDAITTLSNVNAFQNTPIASGTGYIYVPDALLSNYKSATNWSTYANQFKGISEL